jgi:hypothetical protein
MDMMIRTSLLGRARSNIDSLNGSHIHQNYCFTIINKIMFSTERNVGVFTCMTYHKWEARRTSQVPNPEASFNMAAGWTALCNPLPPQSPPHTTTPLTIYSICDPKNIHHVLRLQLILGRRQ